MLFSLTIMSSEKGGDFVFNWLIDPLYYSQSFHLSPMQKFSSFHLVFKSPGRCSTAALF